MEHVRGTAVPPKKISGARPARRVLAALVALFAVTVLVLSMSGAGAKAATGGKAVIVVIDRISLADIVDNPSLPNISKLMSEGSSGLMMVRLRFDKYGIGGYTVIGAGGRMIAGDNAAQAYNADERLESADGTVLVAGDVYRSRAARTARPGSVVNLAIEEMVRASSTYVSTSRPGLMGEALELEGRKVGVVGNADNLAPAAFGVMADGSRVTLTPTFVPLPAGSAGSPPPYPLQTLVHREISCIAMNGRGSVPSGDVSSRLYRVTNKGTGFGTDFKVLNAEATASIAANDLTVVDMGDTSRVDELAEFTSDAATGRARAKALVRCDASLGVLMSRLDPSRDLLVVCAPTPTNKMIAAGDQLTPLIIRGPGFEKSGTIRSETTRRTGLATNFDIAPTVLDFLGVKTPAEMEGQALVSRPGVSTDSLLDLESRAVSASNTKSNMVRLFAIPGLIVIGLLLLLTFVRPELIFDHPYFWSVILLALMAVPLVYMLLPLMALTKIYWSILVTVGMMFAISGLCLLIFVASAKRKEGDIGKAAIIRSALPPSMLLISAVTLILVLLDPILGSPMIALSPFGAGLIAGGRFYGIGNIYMGVAFGAAVLSVCLLPTVFPNLLRTRRRALVTAMIVLLVTVFILGFGRLGANVGAIITGAAITLYVGLRMGGKKIGWKQVLVMVALVIAFLALFLVIDRVLPGSTSHAGKALTRIQGNGVSDAISEAVRKLSLNWKLIMTSTFRLFFFMGLAAAIVWARKYAMFSEVNERYEYLSTAWPALIVGMVVAVIFKDTAIESIGTMMLYYIVPAFLLFMAGRAYEPATQGRKVLVKKKVSSANAALDETVPEAT